MQVGQWDFSNRYSMIFKLDVVRVVVRYPQQIKPKRPGEKKTERRILPPKNKY